MLEDSAEVFSGIVARRKPDFDIVHCNVWLLTNSERLHYFFIRETPIIATTPQAIASVRNGKSTG